MQIKKMVYIYIMRLINVRLNVEDSFYINEEIVTLYTKGVELTLYEVILRKDGAMMPRIMETDMIYN